MTQLTPQQKVTPSSKPFEPKESQKLSTLTHTKAAPTSKTTVRKSKKASPSSAHHNVARFLWTAVILLLFAAAVGLLLNPVRRHAEQSGNLLEPELLFSWIAYSGGTYWLALLLGTTAVFLIWWRRWVGHSHDAAFWNTTCPTCQATALKRTPRTSSDRLLGRLRVPVRRYLCAECGWTGRRIDPNKL